MGIRQRWQNAKARAKRRIERFKRAWRRDDDLREEVADTASETAEDALTSYLSRKREPSITRGASRDSDGWFSGIRDWWRDRDRGDGIDIGGIFAKIIDWIF